MYIGYFVENYNLLCYFLFNKDTNPKMIGVRVMRLDDSQKEINNVLSKLQYFDQQFISHDSHTNTYTYDGYLDTFYRIKVKLIGDDKMEIWDCIYDEENYVRSGIAYYKDGLWEVIEG